MGCESSIPVGDLLAIRILSDGDCAAADEIVAETAKALLTDSDAVKRTGGDRAGHTACELISGVKARESKLVAKAEDSGSACSVMISTPPTSELFVSLTMAFDDAWLDVTHDPDLGVAEEVDGHDVVYTTLAGTCEGRIRLDKSTQPEATHQWLVATLRSSECERVKTVMPDIVAVWQSKPEEGVDLARLLKRG